MVCWCSAVTVVVADIVNINNSICDMKLALNGLTSTAELLPPPTPPLLRLHLPAAAADTDAAAGATADAAGVVGGGG